MENSQLSIWSYFFSLSFMDNCSVHGCNRELGLSKMWNSAIVIVKKSYLCGLQIVCILSLILRRRVYPAGAVGAEQR